MFAGYDPELVYCTLCIRPWREHSGRHRADGKVRCPEKPVKALK